MRSSELSKEGDLILISSDHEVKKFSFLKKTHSTKPPILNVYNPSLHFPEKDLFLVKTIMGGFMRISVDEMNEFCKFFFFFISIFI